MKTKKVTLEFRKNEKPQRTPANQISKKLKFF
jgi:hypothetical protein